MTGTGKPSPSQPGMGQAQARARRPRDVAARVLEIEAAAIRGLLPQIDDGFDRAVALLGECRGRVVCTGMGKSGLVMRKVAATPTAAPIRQASGRTATLTMPVGTAWRGVSVSGPSDTCPSGRATAGKTIASPMKAG